MLDLSTRGFAFPGDCSIVIISGKYTRKNSTVIQVIRTVEHMILTMKATPVAIFLALEDSNTLSNIFLTSSKLPPLVNINILFGFWLKLEKITLGINSLHCDQYKGYHV